MRENKAQKVGENEEWRNYGLTDQGRHGKSLSEIAVSFTTRV